MYYKLIRFRTVGIGCSSLFHWQFARSTRPQGKQFSSFLIMNSVKALSRMILGWSADSSSPGSLVEKDGQHLSSRSSRPFSLVCFTVINRLIVSPPERILKKREAIVNVWWAYHCLIGENSGSITYNRRYHAEIDFSFFCLAAFAGYDPSLTVWFGIFKCTAASSSSCRSGVDHKKTKKKNKNHFQKKKTKKKWWSFVNPDAVGYQMNAASKCFLKRRYEYRWWKYTAF